MGIENTRLGKFCSNTLETGRDMTERAKVKTGLKDKETCQIKTQNGKPTADIDYHNVPADQREVVKSHADMAAGRIDELDKEIKQLRSEGKDAQAHQLTKEKSELQQGLNDFKFEVETSGVRVGLTILLGVFGAGLDQRADMQDVNKAAEKLNLDPPPSVTLDESDMIPPDPMKIIADEAERRGTEGPKDQSVKASDTLSGAELAAMAKNDPDALVAYLDGLSGNGSFVAQQNMQDHMQAQNRMWSTMSNLDKAEHDTQKAIINNMRV